MSGESARIAPLLEALRNRDSAKAETAAREVQGPLLSEESAQVLEAIQQLPPAKDWLPVLQILVDRNPQNAYFPLQLARAYRLIGDDENARQYLREAYRISPDDPNLLNRIAALSYALHDYENTLDWIRHLLELQPANLDAKFLQGCVLARQGKSEDALPLFDEVLAKNPRHPLALFERGKLYNAMNDSAKAEENLRAAVRERPFFGEAYSALVVALSRQKKQADVDQARSIAQALNTWSQEKIARLNNAFYNPQQLSEKGADELASELCLVQREDLAEAYLQNRWESGKLSDAQRIILARLKFNQGKFQPCLDLLNSVTSEEILGGEPYAIFKAWSLYYLGQKDQSRQYLDTAFPKFPSSKYLQELSKKFQGDSPPPDSQTAPETVESSSPAESSSTASDSRRFSFEDATRKAGLDTFKHTLGHPDKIWITDAQGSGVAVADYDNDGDDDIYFVNGRPDLLTPDPKYRNALFRNDDGHFVDVTAAAGVGDLGFGMCAVFGDVDNDGRLDLFVGNYGADAMYRNNGDGTFTDITESSGLGDPGYAAAAAFADVDRDNDLDLYVGNYVDFDPRRHADLRTDFYGIKVFAGPLMYQPQGHRLYFNDGKGVFTDRAAEAGINTTEGRAMGAAFFYFDSDDLLDLYVTNDSTYNFVLQNKGDGTFEDVSFASGGAVNDNGVEGASMGVAVGDYNNDGFLDLYVTSYEQQTDVLYRNNGNETFQEVTSSVGLSVYTRMLVTWGCNLADFDSDGLLDVFTADGHLYPQVDSLSLGRKYNQGVSLYRNTGSSFENLSSTALPPDFQPSSGRGSALIDFDRDGDMDVVVNNIDSAPLLLENRSPQGRWLEVEIVAPAAVKYGLRVVARKGDRQWTRLVDGGSGYLSQNTAVLHFGLGDMDALDNVIIYWPGRDPQVLPSPPLNSRLQVTYPYPVPEKSASASSSRTVAGATE